MGNFITLVCYLTGALGMVTAILRAADEDWLQAAFLFGAAVGTFALGFIVDALRIISEEMVKSSTAMASAQTARPHTTKVPPASAKSSNGFSEAVRILSVEHDGSVVVATPKGERRFDSIDDLKHYTDERKS